MAQYTYNSKVAEFGIKTSTFTYQGRSVQRKCFFTTDIKLDLDVKTFEYVACWSLFI